VRADANISSSLTYPGANPTIVSYNASIVKIYNATTQQRAWLQKTLALYIVVNSEVVGLAPGMKFVHMYIPGYSWMQYHVRVETWL
jgi:hypothetical protein